MEDAVARLRSEFEDEKQAAVSTKLPTINGLSLSFSSTPIDYAAPKVSLADGKSKPFITSEKPKSGVKPSAPSILMTKQSPVRRVEFPYERLADKLKGYGIVCYASDKVFSVLNNMFFSSLHKSNILCNKLYLELGVPYSYLQNIIIF